MQLPERADVVVVGAGIVGLATAVAIRRRLPGRTVVVLEKEADVALHQTGHNSGVIHSGIYYRPGSLKARLCVEGARRLKEFCTAHGIPWEGCGKVVVAVDESEVPRLEELFRRGTGNGVEGLRMLDGRELRRLEPHAAGVAALHSPATGIVDYRQVAGRLRALLEQDGGGRVVTGAAVVAVEAGRGGVRVRTGAGWVQAGFLVNCAGLFSDRIARLSGLKPPVRIVPFRGEYYRLRPQRAHLVRNLIYPVPDPRLPFLGVHLTRTVHGEVEAGPNAVLAFAREGYRMGVVRPGDLAETLSYPGFWRMARRWWRTGLAEMVRSCSRRAFAREVRRLLPEVRDEDLERAGAGVRAQAVRADGTLEDDFAIVEVEGALHVLNAPSPAATSSLAIGEYLAERVAAQVPQRVGR